MKKSESVPRIEEKKKRKREEDESVRIKGHKSWNHPWDKSGLSSINSPWIEVEKGDSELARSTVKEPCCREGKKPPFVAVFQIF